MQLLEPVTCSSTHTSCINTHSCVDARLPAMPCKEYHKESSKTADCRPVHLCTEQPSKPQLCDKVTRPCMTTATVADTRYAAALCAQRLSPCATHAAGIGRAGRPHTLVCPSPNHAVPPFGGHAAYHSPLHPLASTPTAVSVTRHPWLFATPSHTQSASSHKRHRASHSKHQMKTATTDARWAGLLPQSALHPIHPIPSCKSPHPGQHPHQVKMTPRERASA